MTTPFTNQSPDESVATPEGQATTSRAGQWTPWITGGAVALSSLRLLGLGGTLLALAGGTAIYRMATGRWPGEKWLVARATEARGAELGMTETITVQRPVEEVYRYWRNVENLPRFMRHLESVEQLSDGKSRWRVKVPNTEITIEWESEITEERENECLAWRSLPDAAIYNEGNIRLKPATGGRGTELKATILYRPPAGAIGTAVARLINALPAQLVKEDLRRFKQVMEAGEIPTIEGQPSGST
jgi:uncharacterized membrane protein